MADYIPIDQKRRQHANMTKEREKQGVTLREGDSWAKKQEHEVVCKCSRKFKSKVHISFTRHQVITQKKCPGCQSQTDSASTTLVT